MPTSPVFTLRAMQPDDGAALQRLMENDPETPGMSMTTRFLVDAYTAWSTLRPDMLGVVAEVADTGEIVGTGTVAFDDVQFDGRVLPSAFLENLKVHHLYRGQGLGKQLANWRVEKARERFGADGVILTGTDAGNTASLATMKVWSRQVITGQRVAARPAHSRPPKAPAGITVRPAAEAEWREIAERCNRFYAGYNLYPPLTAEKIGQYLRIAPPVYEYRVAIDAGGHLVAGAMLQLRARLMIDEFRNMPLPLRLMNAVLHIIPGDHLVRLVEVGYLWHERLDAAQYLWNAIRWDYRGEANNFTHGFDARSSLADVFQLKPWHQPKIEITLAVSGPAPMDEAKWVSGSLRG